MKRADRLRAAECLEGHDWRTVSLSVEDRGAYRGSARRERLCQRCSGLRIEHIDWAGRVMSRSYKSDPDYLKACRSFSQDVHERRVRYREDVLKEAFRGAHR